MFLLRTVSQSESQRVTVTQLAVWPQTTTKDRKRPQTSNNNIVFVELTIDSRAEWESLKLRSSFVQILEGIPRRHSKKESEKSLKIQRNKGNCENRTQKERILFGADFCGLWWTEYLRKIRKKPLYSLFSRFFVKKKTSCNKAVAPKHKALELAIWIWDSETFPLIRERTGC